MKAVLLIMLQHMSEEYSYCNVDEKTMNSIVVKKQLRVVFDKIMLHLTTVKLASDSSFLHYNT